MTRLVFAKIPKKPLVILGVALTFWACGSINDSWEVKGGGFIKYKVDGEGPFTLEMEDDEVIRPTNGRSYFYVETDLEASKRGDQFHLTVNRPTLGKNSLALSYSWMIIQNSAKSPILSNYEDDSSYVDFDQKDDSTWTADLNLYVTDCRNGLCNDKIPPLHLIGRFRYWVPEDDR